MDTVLLLEANPKHADIIRRHLENNGFNVLVSGDIPAMKSTLNLQLPDLFVIDLNIPPDELPGLYRWLGATPGVCDIPRVFITGKKREDIAGIIKLQKGETVLHKPLNINEFIRALKQQPPPKETAELKKGQDYLSSLIGKKIGSAVIREEIGRGGMGAVFLGHQETLNRQVAVKLLLPGIVGDDIATERFQREARAIAQLKSPHIVQIFDFAELDNQAFYIIMEYLSGKTIEFYLARNGRFPMEKAVSVIAQVARGLNTAHDAGLIHRDIKPSNLIMNHKGHVTITDFGLVKRQKSIKQTQTGIVFGTPQYISPEQVSGKKQDARSDIYSLGLVFYQLLTGNVPFTSESPVELMMKHLNDPLPDLREVMPSIPLRVVEIIERMAAKDPAERYINCRELLWELEALDLKKLSTPVVTGEKEDPPTVPSGEAFTINTKFNAGFSTLEKHFPTLFTRDRLLGAMTISESGNILNQKGRVPDRWKNILYILFESSKQLNAAAELGDWHFTITTTPEELAALFPQEPNLGTMVFNQKESTFSSMGIQTQSMASAQAAADPIKKIASIAGVEKALLFNDGGELAQSTLEDTAALKPFKQRFAPVVEIIRSIPFALNDIDIWFEKGRILVWRLDSGMLFLITSLDIGKSFLSIFVLTHLEQLNTSTRTITLTPSKKRATVHPPVDNPVSATLMKGIQLELARMVGPIAKVLLSRELKKMGYSVGNYPEDRLRQLTEKLASKVDASRRQKFIDNVQDLIYDSRGGDK